MALQEAMHKFRRGPLRRSADERQLQRQRRKSVPSFSPEDTVVPNKTPTGQSSQQEREPPIEHSSTHGRRNRRGSAQMNEEEKQEYVKAGSACPQVFIAMTYSCTNRRAVHCVLVSGWCIDKPRPLKKQEYVKAVRTLFAHSKFLRPLLIHAPPVDTQCTVCSFLPGA